MLHALIEVRVHCLIRLLNVDLGRGQILQHVEVFLLLHYVLVLLFDLAEEHGSIRLSFELALIGELIRRQSWVKELLDFDLALPDLVSIFGELQLECFVNLSRPLLSLEPTFLRIGGEVL